VEYGDQLSVNRRCPITERLNWICLSEPIETCEQANALTAGKFGLGRAPAEKQAIQFTIAEELVKFVYRDVGKEYDRQPYLN